MIIVDTGPLVAFLNKDDVYHEWAVQQFNDLPTPFFTCEGTLIEASHLSKKKSDIATLLSLVSFGAIIIGFSVHQETENPKELISKYKDVPMDLVDACLVRMSELYPDAELLTIDSDFHIYRRNRTHQIPLIMPN